MSWSIGAQEDHTWRQEEDTGKKKKWKQERKRGRGGEIEKIRSETQKYKSERLLETELRNKKKDQSKKKSHSMLVARQMTYGSWQGGGSRK